jgi:hypothetical protein
MAPKTPKQNGGNFILSFNGLRVRLFVQRGEFRRAENGGGSGI